MSIATDINHSVIEPTAIIGKNAKIGKNVRIGHYAIVEDYAEIGDGCVLNSHAIVRRFTILKEQVFVDSFAAVGGDNQDLKCDPSTEGGVIVGANTKIREGVTIHRASHSNDYTVVGSNCLLMANSHVAHDCVLGDNIILANNALLAGHIKAYSNCILSGGVACHQFIRIGEFSMTSGNTTVTYDMPPFVMVIDRNQVRGLNIVGIRRAGFSAEDLQDLKYLYHALMETRGNPAELAAQVRAEGVHGQTPAGQIFLKFFAEESTRGYLRAY